MQECLQKLAQGGVLPVSGVCPGAQACLAVWLRQHCPGRGVVAITDGLKSQEAFQQDAETWFSLAAAGPGQPLFYPAWENLPQEGKLPHADVISERLETLMALATWDPAGRGAAPFVVTSVAALLQRTFPAETLRKHLRPLRRGDRVDPLDLVEWLEEEGYEPEAKITQKGELALRGGILDVYPPASPWPVRLEFFGDELDSLRFFDPHTQISRETVAEVTLTPAGELGVLRQWLKAHPDPAGAAVRPGDRLGTLLDYLPAGTLLLVCEPESVARHAQDYAAQVAPGDPFFIAWPDWTRAASELGLTRLDLSEANFTAPEAEGNPPADPAPALAPLAPWAWPAAGAAARPLDLGLASLDTYRSILAQPSEPEVAELQRREFLAQIHRWLRQDYRVWLFCNNDGERQRFEEIWHGQGLGRVAPAGAADAPAAPADSGAGPPAGEAALAPLIQVGSLSRGFLFEAGRLAVVTDAEIFGRYKVQRTRRLKSKHAAAMRSALDIDFTELEEGDYVVHLQHGIGRYLGLRVLPVTAGTQKAELGGLREESRQECLVIEYAPREPDQPPPKLYVPITEAHLVSKYVGAGRARPQLHTLGGSRWAKAKAQAEHAVRDLAAELLSIQAARASQPGRSFGPDTAWQLEFESAFLFEETPGQLRAIRETKTDMEASRPMDRLICGDVGFGKTEVAIRAAFKAVMSGAQVAILVPTTVLAQQHFNTFRERLADYPICVELLSRFRSRREQQAVVHGLAAGSVDIVIGTHRLVQADIAFKDLGLVVIDEEQRFGVMHKEKFKRLRRLVDVLTLSATPIPRTLYLALTGARDMSTIETPPQDRLPVETIVAAYDERLIRDAIQRELNRQGQVFFLHNRVETIEVMAQKLKTLLPQARLVVGHGQMDSDDLEEVMTRFINGEADVLLSTTIIESGLDIPNANTIIIDRADRFGLSDLYQLRGRVGRYKHQAYAILLLPRHAGILSDARKRLSAIKQYSSLGSGFKIAMRDLELRGAGNLLGSEQSGHITAVGFDLYCKLLKKSVGALKGEPAAPTIEVGMRIDFLAFNPEEAESASTGPELFEEHEVRKAPAFIPLKYIADAHQRIEFYRKLAQVADSGALARLAQEMKDRFGPPPRAVDLLCEVTSLRLLAASKSVTEVRIRQDKIMLLRGGNYLTLQGKFPRLTKKDAKARLREIRKLLAVL